MNHIVDTRLCLTYSVMSIQKFDLIKNAPEHKYYLDQASLYIIGKREKPVLIVNEENCNQDMIALKALQKKQRASLDIFVSRELNPEIGLNGFQGLNRVVCMDEADEDSQSKTENEETPLSSKNSDPLEFEIVEVKAIDENGNIQITIDMGFDDIIWLISHGDTYPYALISIKGNLVPFLTFEVLYVGKCTDEPLTQRFNGHHALQKMLIREKAITPNLRNSEELFLFPMKSDGDIISVISGYTDPKEAIRAFSGKFTFGSREISLDAEKALVHAMNPKYNKIKFENYPKSKDGLYNTEADIYAYSLSEFFILHYKDGSIIGHQDATKASRIAGDKSGFAHVYAPGERILQGGI